MQQRVDSMEEAVSGNFLELCKRLEDLVRAVDSHVELGNELLRRSERTLPIKLVFWIVGLIFLAVANDKILSNLPGLASFFFPGK